MSTSINPFQEQGTMSYIIFSKSPRCPVPIFWCCPIKRTLTNRGGRGSISFFFSVYKNKTTLPPPRWRTRTHFDMIAWGGDGFACYFWRESSVAMLGISQWSIATFALSILASGRANQSHPTIPGYISSPLNWLLLNAPPLKQDKKSSKSCKMFFEQKKKDILYNQLDPEEAERYCGINSAAATRQFFLYPLFILFISKKKKQGNSICDILQCGRRRWQSEIHDRGVVAFKRQKKKKIKVSPNASSPTFWETNKLFFSRLLLVLALLSFPASLQLQQAKVGKRVGNLRGYRWV